MFLKSNQRRQSMAGKIKKRIPVVIITEVIAKLVNEGVITMEQYDAVLDRFMEQYDIILDIVNEALFPKEVKNSQEK
jgi:hypothetical protein